MTQHSVVSEGGRLKGGENEKELYPSQQELPAYVLPRPLPCIASAGHMREDARICDPERSSHAHRRDDGICYCKSLTPFILHSMIPVCPQISKTLRSPSS